MQAECIAKCAPHRIVILQQNTGLCTAAGGGGFSSFSWGRTSVPISLLSLSQKILPELVLVPQDRFLGCSTTRGGTSNSHAHCGSQGIIAMPTFSWQFEFAFSLRFARDYCDASVPPALNIYIFAAFCKGVLRFQRSTDRQIPHFHRGLQGILRFCTEVCVSNL